MSPSRKQSKPNPSKEQSVTSSKDSIEQGSTTSNDVEHAAASDKQVNTQVFSLPVGVVKLTCGLAQT